MKKLTLALGFVIFLTTIQAQEVVTWEGLKKRKAKTDKKIQNPKKNVKYKTWAERGNTYFTIATFNTQGLYEGLPAKGGVASAEFTIGKPQTIKSGGGKEIWVYPHKELTFQGGTLKSWKETEFIDKEAIKKAAEAYLKAAELDTKGKFQKKTSTKNQAAQIRGVLINKGVDLYTNSNYKPAYNYLQLAKKMGEFPKTKTDTAYKSDMIEYYCGIIGKDAKMYEKSRVHFKSCIKNNYQPATSYHHMAGTWLEQGDSAKYEATVKEGFDKFPDNEQLVIDLINYYMGKGESESVIKFLDVAIKKNPANASYYSAKASIFDNKDEDAYTVYRAKKEEYLKLKKEAFRARNKAKSVLAPIEKKRDAALADAEKLKQDYFDTFAKAEALYKQAISVKADFFNALFNLGRLNYKMNERYRKEADDIPYSADKDGKKSGALKEKGLKHLKIAVDYFEKAHKSNPKDKNTVEILSNSYRKLKNKAKADEYAAKAATLN